MLVGYVVAVLCVLGLVAAVAVVNGFATFVALQPDTPAVSVPRGDHLRVGATCHDERDDPANERPPE